MTHGSLRWAVTRDGQSRWVIDADPDVHLRAKRVFPKISKSASGRLSISDTPDTCRDLEWFLQRYPLEMTDADRARLTTAAAAHHETILSLQQIIGDGYQPQTFALTKPARPYQAREAELLLKTGRLLVGDDVGLGKTIVGICTMTDPRTLPAIVVCLTHLQRQWEDKIREFAPTLRTHILRKVTPYAWPKFFGSGPDVIITSYHKLAGWTKVLSTYGHSIIFDEVQELRRDGSAKYVAAKEIAGAMHFRLGLSATPIYNYGGEIFNVFEVLAPNALGTSTEFHQEWTSGLDPKGRAILKDAKAFGMWTRREGLMIRHTRAEVKREIPPVQRIMEVVEAEEAALKAIEGPAGELAQLILSHNPEHLSARFEASSRLSYLLRQATGIAKAPYVAAFVRMLVESGERPLLAGWHHEVYGIWRERLKDLNPVMYTGQETASQKEAAVAAFTKGDSKVLVLSLRAGAGIDGLQQVSSCVVFGELDWSPAVHEQFIGRVARDGQQNPVVAYFLTSETGSDPAIIDVLGVKRQQVEGIRNPTLDFLEQVDTTGGHARRLAEQYLQQLGRKVIEPSSVHVLTTAPGAEDLTMHAQDGDPT